MATFTNATKNSSSISNLMKSAQDINISIGQSIGLLLSLTYAEEITSSGISYSNLGKNSSSMSNQNKNNAIIGNITKNASSFVNTTKN